MEFVPPTSFDVYNVKVQLCVMYKYKLYNFLPHVIITIIIPGNVYTWEGYSNRSVSSCVCVSVCLSVCVSPVNS